MPIDEKEYYLIRNLQLVLDVQAILENLDATEIPNGLSSDEYKQVAEIIRGWERRLRNAVQVDTDEMKKERCT